MLPKLTDEQKRLAASYYPLVREVVDTVRREVSDRRRLTADVEDDLETEAVNFLMRLVAEVPAGEPESVVASTVAAAFRGAFWMSATSAAWSVAGSGGGGAARFDRNRRRRVPTVPLPDAADDFGPSYTTDPDPVAETQCPYPNDARRLAAGETVDSVYDTAVERQRFYKVVRPAVREHLERFYDRREQSPTTFVGVDGGGRD